MQLSKRLGCIASLVTPGAHPVDVGTDHGYVPAWLVQEGICAHAIASDIHAGPLQRAASLMEELELTDKVELILCDGLEGCPAEEIDTVIIAGMGGETIAAILEKAPWTREGRKLILQPMTKSAELRRWLTAAGFSITGEHLIEEDGRLYEILSAEPGTSAAYTEAEYHVGRFEQLQALPLASKRLDQVIGKLEAALTGLKKSTRTEDASRCAELQQACDGLREMKERLKS